VRRVREEVLDNCLADNVNAWQLQPDGSYERCTPADGEPAHSAQGKLLEGLLT
jgi:polyphosphate kinase